jgi:hypothetical protein
MHLPFSGRVEPVGRSSITSSPRPGQQCGSEPEPPAHAEGEAANPVVGDVGEPDLVEHVGDGEAQQEPEQSGLPGAVRPDQAMDLTPRSPSFEVRRNPASRQTKGRGWSGLEQDLTGSADNEFDCSTGRSPRTGDLDQKNAHRGVGTGSGGLTRGLHQRPGRCRCPSPDIAAPFRPVTGKKVVDA